MKETNVTEWIYTEKLKTLLSMCGEPEEQIGENASDYSFFEAFCRSFELLTGNKTAQQIAWHLEHTLGVSLPISSHNCHRLWQLCADRLLEDAPQRPNWKEDFSFQTDEETLEKYTSVLQVYSVTKELDALGLLLPHTTSLDIWQREIKTFLIGQEGPILFTLPKTYRFLAPDPYHVESALKNGGEAQNLLLSQLMRILSEECSRKDLCLILRIECDTKEAVRLLEYTEVRVGLPELILSAKSLEDIALLCPLVAKGSKKKRRFAVCPADFYTTDCYYRFLTSYAACYPIGMLGQINKKEAD